MQKYSSYGKENDFQGMGGMILEENIQPCTVIKTLQRNFRINWLFIT